MPSVRASRFRRFEIRLFADSLPCAADVLWAHFGRVEEPVPAFDTSVSWCVLAAVVLFALLARRGR